MTISNFLETSLMDAVFNSAAYDNTTGVWVKLYIGDPGENGTNNAAGETTRKQATNAASSGGVFTSTNDLTWVAVSTTETYSHVALWDDVAAGNCLWTGALTVPKAVTAGDTFTIPTGSLVVSLD